MRMILVLPVLTLAAAGCGGASRSQAAASAGEATAELRDASGRVVGTATFADVQGGVTVLVQLDDAASPGEHGIHVHEVGRCDPPDFESAGEHFNPEGKKHGAKNPDGPHAGDLPNVSMEDDRDGRLESRLDGASLTGDKGLLDADGSAIVLHAQPDDYETDPSGNSGERIACGVITAAGGGM